MNSSGNMISDIADSIWLEIFSYLPKRDLVNASTVCSRWRRVALDKYLWREISSEEIELSNLVKDKVVTHLLNYGQNIESLTLLNCSKISNKVLLTLSLNSTRLHTLNLEGCLNISDRGVKSLAKSCKTLKSINLLDARVTETGLSYLVAENLKLTELKASTSAVTEYTIQVLTGHCKQLVDLHVEPNIDLIETGAIKQSKEVLTNEMLVYIAVNCPCLATLILHYPVVLVSDWAMAILGLSCKILECIEFGSSDQESKISDVGVVNLCLPLKKLRRLELKDTEVTDVSLHAIASSCTDIEHLDLQNCRKLSDIGILDLIKHCQNLESLTLGSGWEGNLTNISAIGLSQSQCVKNLVSLKMYTWDITDFGLYVLSTRLSQLVHMSIEGCTKITYNGLKESLEMLSSLKTIDLSFTQCIKSDAELLSLVKYFRELWMLVMYECRGVSAYGLNDLKSYLPFCAIKSEKIMLM